MKKYIFPSVIMVLGLGLITCGIANNKMPAKEVVNNCPYEGAECPNVQNYLRDYQIDLHMDTMWLYDGNRLVDIHIDTSWNHGIWLDSTMMKDNL